MANTAPAASESQWIAYNDPMWTDAEPYANRVVHMTTEDAIAAFRRIHPDFTGSDEDALASFMAVHSAWYVSAPQTNASDVKSLQDFAKWVICEGAFQATDLDGLSIQEKAHELGLIEAMAYDPEKHGPSDCAKPGDDWFVFSPLLSTLTAGEVGELAKFDFEKHSLKVSLARAETKLAEAMKVIKSFADMRNSYEQWFGKPDLATTAARKLLKENGNG